MPTFKINVGTEIRKILVYNEKRTAVAIKSMAGSKVYLSEDPQNVLENGFPLDAGDAVVFRKSDGDMPEKALYACTETGTAELRIWEVFG